MILFKKNIAVLKFGGKNFRQESGGPIGVWATGAASQLVVEDWADEYFEILRKAGLWIALEGGYVDDGRQITTQLEKGLRFEKETKSFRFSKEGYEEDLKLEQKGESPNEFMARICTPVMNSVNDDLKFTTETQETFEKERLPTLDFEIWIEKGKVHHSYFQKPMKTPFLLIARSAMCNHQKIQINSNELTRRLSNISIGSVEHQEILDIIEQFIQELKNSDYNQKQAREMVCSGIKGWQSRYRKRKRKGQNFYRLAKETVHERMLKELTQREDWYKGTKGDDDEESPRKVRKVEGNQRKKGNMSKKEKEPEVQTTSVLFVPHTTGSNLAKEIRKKEDILKDVTGNKVKVVERAGMKIQDLLVKDPWKGKDCGRENCLLCTTKMITGKGKRKDCTKRNLVYEIKCMTCDENAEKELEKEYDDKPDELEEL